MTVKTTVATRSMIGPRDENQDRGYAEIGESGEWAIAVADGLGGHVRGAEAAQAAIEQMRPDIGGVSEMSDLFAAADAEVAQMYTGHRGFSMNWSKVPMTTLCVATFLPSDSEVLVGWSGDTVAYMIESDEGALSAYRACKPHNHDNGSIARCLGLNGLHEVREVPAGLCSGIAVCSDGAWEPLGRKFRANGDHIYFETPLDCDWEAGAVADLLLRRADELGLADNATVAVACW